MRQTGGMTGRGWWTVVLTALAAPLGSFGLALGLARSAEMSTGGMAVLAGAIAGLVFGAPLTAIIVYGICLVTLMRGAPLRRWISLLIMLATAVAALVVIIVGLRIVGGMAYPQAGLVGTGVVVAIIVGAGAYAGLMAARRPVTSVAVAG